MRVLIFDDKNNLYNHILDNNNIELKTLSMPTGSTPLVYKE
jgi:hypothetical protein